MKSCKKKRAAKDGTDENPNQIDGTTIVEEQQKGQRKQPKKKEKKR